MGKKILVVDDDATCLTMTALMLAKSGYDVLRAKNGAEALSVAAEELPDLVLLDVQLPDLSGFEAVNTLRKTARTKDLKIVALTAFKMSGDRELILATGYDGYIPKPLPSQKAFTTLIESYLK